MTDKKSIFIYKDEKLFEAKLTTSGIGARGESFVFQNKEEGETIYILKHKNVFLPTCFIAKKDGTGIAIGESLELIAKMMVATIEWGSKSEGEK